MATRRFHRLVIGCVVVAAAAFGIACNAGLVHGDNATARTATGVLLGTVVPLMAAIGFRGNSLEKDLRKAGLVMTYDVEAKAVKVVTIVEAAAAEVANIVEVTSSNRALRLPE